MPPELRSEYGTATMESARECAEELVVDWAWDPADVVDAATRALTCAGARHLS